MKVLLVASLVAAVGAVVGKVTCGPHQPDMTCPEMRGDDFYQLSNGTDLEEGREQQHCKDLCEAEGTDGCCWFGREEVEGNQTCWWDSLDLELNETSYEDLPEGFYGASICRYDPEPTRCKTESGYDTTYTTEATNHAECIFPFEYSGWKFYDCTDHENNATVDGDQKWCATEVDENGELLKWSWCNDVCLNFEYSDPEDDDWDVGALIGFAVLGLVVGAILGLVAFKCWQRSQKATTTTAAAKPIKREGEGQQDPLEGENML
mmetsp:Transcript_3899/g.4507  ORF Transcript_3899/g.4507 Transcript_3899/m.4507 type:complete len:263 (-) Transcript_3899:137-925(-)|eukprot:CAMPEP_0205824244 /NCGR_PEP_ID=MMETSP0206-20130828/20151_1 /ASSEMBLY_ACC=CAM_ASM_000279 /TAXON_ID=36767 /ORGANISM="Euplotes focardii, Strain TN1" /LENGTH=262 /DNA_ID=CAMNT_0053122187 /DNA_START=32 /DNA_END=820 /DNA_ORIENTATION=+